MLTFFETPWYIISSAIFFIAGIIFCIHQKGFFKVPVGMSLSLYLYHTFFSMYYMYYSINNITDSPYYYYSSLTDFIGFDFGTLGIVFFTSIFSNLFGMSYAGIFLVYNVIGFIGIIAFASALIEILGDNIDKSWLLIVLIAFLPGIHFWSSAIGKDSLAFFSTGLLCWSSLQIKKRFFALSISIFVFFLARPHIALAALIAFGTAFVLFGNVRIHIRVMLAAILLPIVVAGAALTLNKVGLDGVSNISDVADYVETRQSYNMEGGGGIDISSMSIPMRAISYLYRPLPLEIPGLLGIVVGIENIILIILSIYFLKSFVNNNSILSAFSLSAMLLFSIICIVLLSNTTSNLGIAIRQKWMFFPMIICVGMSYYSNIKRIRG